jgi:hypothetical protein
MAKMTVNALLSMEKSLRVRQAQLNELKNAGTSRSIYRSLDKTENITEPTYNIKLVDRKLAAINMALFRIDKAVKQSNAKTSVDVDVEFETLMSEIELGGWRE